MKTSEDTLPQPNPTPVSGLRSPPRPRSRTGAMQLSSLHEAIRKLLGPGVLPANSIAITKYVASREDGAVRSLALFGNSAYAELHP
jgi:hypothetical protein